MAGLIPIDASSCDIGGTGATTSGNAESWADQLADDLKPPASTQEKDAIQVLKNALSELESERKQTPRIADLKRILEERIAELESQRKDIR